MHEGYKPMGGAMEREHAAMHGARKPMTPKRSTAKARAGKKSRAEAKAMHGGPAPEGYYRLG